MKKLTVKLIWKPLKTVMCYVLSLLLRIAYLSCKQTQYFMIEQNAYDKFYKQNVNNSGMIAWLPVFATAVWSAALGLCYGTPAAYLWLCCCNAAALLRHYSDSDVALHHGSAVALLRHSCGTAAALLQHCCGTAAALLRQCRSVPVVLLRYMYSCFTVMLWQKAAVV